MSGGSFDYAYLRVEDFVEELDKKIKCNNDENVLDDPMYGYGPLTILRLIECKELLANAARAMKEIEWLYSADSGEKTFAERVDQILELYE